MRFHETKVRGVFLIEMESLEDERGFFARTYCQQEFELQGLNPCLAQCSVSFNKKRGTVRGMHFQASPNQEAKLVRCTRGAIWDVVLDVRPAAPTFGQWVATELSADNHRQIYVAEGLAHGFQTLQDDTEVFYQMSALYCPESSHGLLWNDPAFRITWPIEVSVISPKDLSYPPFHVNE